MTEPDRSPLLVSERCARHAPALLAVTRTCLPLIVTTILGSSTGKGQEPEPSYRMGFRFWGIGISQIDAPYVDRLPS